MAAFYEPVQHVSSVGNADEVRRLAQALKRTLRKEDNRDLMGRAFIDGASDNGDLGLLKWYEGFFDAQWFCLQTVNFMLGMISERGYENPATLLTPDVLKMYDGVSSVVAPLKVPHSDEFDVDGIILAALLCGESDFGLLESLITDRRPHNADEFRAMLANAHSVQRTVSSGVL